MKRNPTGSIRKGPTVDEHGNRVHSAAGQAVNQTFGGLALGFSGTTPEKIQNDTTYRSPIFRPGTNLGPPYIDELKMSTACIPQLVAASGDPRTKNLAQASKRPQVEAVFYPPPPKGHAKVKGEKKQTETGSACIPRPLPECPGEGGSKRTFLIFGQPEKQEPIIYCPPVFETSEATVYEYFEAHNIEGLMEHFMTLLCIHLPDDPFEYMQDLSKQMIKARHDKAEAEKMDVVFEPSHLLAMFSLFDKGDTKVVSVEQYKNAMEMLGLSRYNPQPLGYSENSVTEDVFFDETTKALAHHFKSFSE